MLRFRSRQRGVYSSLESAIRALFAASEQGAWYDPSDLSTLFQDSAGTTPVTAVGQPVGMVRDKSGRGNHASQTTAASRPILQQDSGGRYYLAFDGVDDWLQTGSIDFTGTDKMSVFAGVRKLSDVTQVIMDLSASPAANVGTLALEITSNNYSSYVRGTEAARETVINITAPDTSVLAVQSDVIAASAGAATDLRRNKASGGSVAGVAPAGTVFGNYPLFIGRRGGSSLSFNGRIYSLIVRGALSSQSQIEAAERYVNSKTGAY